MLNEACRYLGIQGEADDKTLRLVSNCLEIIQRVSAPKNITRRFSSEDFTPFLIGEDIKKHLDGTKEIILLAATLGIGVDRVIKKAQATDMAQAAALDACAAAYIERYLDMIMPDELPSHRRFSPGYGDYPLSLQPRLLKAVHADKIGITVLKSHMLVPTKSVTAVIGAGQENACVTHKCKRCNKKDCAFRMEDKDES